MFVALKWKGTAMDRNESETLDGYIRQWGNNEKASYSGYEPLVIESVENIKNNARGDRGYATGSFYLIKGTVGKVNSIEDTKFRIMHNVRNDYYNAFPIKNGTIKLFKI